MTSVWTVGHSTRTLAEFLELLAAFEIEAIADVRRYAGSRRWPHFGHDAIAEALAGRGVEYVWIPELGGRRRPLPDSPNTGWRSAAFRGYADYMASGPFADGFISLINLALGFRTAIMCAEAVWWRCHRALIADLLRWLGLEVIHILGPKSSSPHPYTSAAHVDAGRLSYSARNREP